MKTMLVGIEEHKVQEGTDFEESYSLAHNVYDEHPQARTHLDENGLNLYLGKHIVEDYYNGVFHEGYIPMHYCVRTFYPTLKYWSFVCGLDLTPCGKVWTSLNRDKLFDSVDEAMEFIEEKEGSKCIICTEEKLKVG